jgi:toxin FitB
MSGPLHADVLVDTNIISELSRNRPDARVVKFFVETPRILVSVMVFHELAYGVDVAATDRKPELGAFLATMRTRFGPRALPVTVAIAELAGGLRASQNNQGRILTVTDSLLAATAIAHGAVLVTRNVKDFVGVDVRVLNPFEGG